MKNKKGICFFIPPDIGVLFFLLISILANRFWLLPKIATHVFRGIPNIYTWMALWNCRVLETFNLQDYWHSNAMYPYSNAFAFSENMMGYTPFVYPIWKLTGNPILTVNILSLLLLWLIASVTYLVLKRIVQDRLSAIVGALMFSLYPWILKELSLGRFHMLGLFWLPLILLFNWRFWNTGKKKYLIWMGLLMFWTFLISIYLGIFLTVLLGLWLFFWLLYERKLFGLKKIFHWCLSVFLVWLAMLPIFMIYNRVATRMGVTRTLENQMQYTGNILSWLTTTDENWLWGQTFRFLPVSTRDGIVESFMFPGVIVIFLFAISFVVRTLPPWVKGLRWTGLTLALLAIGPFIVGLPWKIPMPFTALWYLFPPLKATRNPHRFAVFAILAIVFVSVFILSRMKMRKSVSRAVKCILILGLLIESFSVVKPHPGIKKTTPLIYEKLEQDKGGKVLIEMPMDTETNLKALTYSSFHWNKIVNGISAYWPPLLHQLGTELREFPSVHTCRLLQALDVDRIIIHENKYSPKILRRIKTRLREMPDIRFVDKLGLQSLWVLQKGAKRLDFSPKKHITLSVPSSMVGERATVSVDIPLAQTAIIFNDRAPFDSRFLSSREWVIQAIDVKGRPLSERVIWKAPALFHRYNWRKSISIQSPPIGSKEIRIRVSIMDTSLVLKKESDVKPVRKTQIPLPTYLSLAEKDSEAPLEKLCILFSVSGFSPSGQNGKLACLEGRVKIQNPGPYHWYSGRQKGVRLGVKVIYGENTKVYFYDLAHDLHPGDSITQFISIPLPSRQESIKVSINGVGQLDETFDWFPEKNTITLFETSEKRIESEYE